MIVVWTGAIEGEEEDKEWDCKRGNEARGEIEGERVEEEGD